MQEDENNVVPMTEEPQYGIKETSEAVVAVVKTGNTLDKCLEDGKFDVLKDSLEMSKVIPEIIAAIKDGSLIVKEVSDLDENEWEKIEALVSELEFRDESLERLTEKAINLIVALAEFMIEIRDAKK